MSDNDRCPTRDRAECPALRAPDDWYARYNCVKRAVDWRSRYLADRAAWAEERARMLSDLDRFRAEVHERLGVLERERDMARAERDGASEERARLVAERDGFNAARYEATKRADSHHRRAQLAEAERDALRAKLQAVEQDAAAWRKLFEENPRALWARLQTAEAERDAAIARAEALAKALGEACDLIGAYSGLAAGNLAEATRQAAREWRALAASPDTTAPSDRGGEVG